MIDVNNVYLTYRINGSNCRSIKEYLVHFHKRKEKRRTFNALNGVSFHVEKGEVLGLIGENGAGKSTLLKVITGILKPTKGSYVARGTIVPMLELGCGFDFELTGRENIYLNGSILGFSKKYIDEKYDDILAFSELGDFINEPIRTYSSGMMMRLGFSIAVMCQPDILIVDEILAVGDDRFQEKSYNKMMELMHNGTTVILVSHNMGIIKSLCDHVVWLDKGKVKMDGKTEEVCKAYTER